MSSNNIVQGCQLNASLSIIRLNERLGNGLQDVVIVELCHAYKSNCVVPGSVLG